MEFTKYCLRTREIGLMAARQLILNIDNAAGRFFSIRLPAYIQEGILVEGAGPYTRDEWSTTRILGYRGAGLGSSELDDDARYLTRIFQTQYRNFVSAQRLCDLLDFRDYDSVLELGCGEMVQAFVITRMYPHLRYCATDLDPYVIEKCSRLSSLSQVQKRVLDIQTLTTDDLQGFQLVLSWEVAYALDDSALERLFGVVGRARASMVICTTQLIGPLHYVVRRAKRIPVRTDGKPSQKGLRMHGWHHTPGYYQRFSQKCGMTLKRIWHPTIRSRHEDNFTMLLFVPRR